MNAQDKAKMRTVLDKARSKGYQVLDFSNIPASVDWDELEKDDGEFVETISFPPGVLVGDPSQFFSSETDDAINHTNCKKYRRKTKVGG